VAGTTQREIRHFGLAPGPAQAATGSRR